MMTKCNVVPFDCVDHNKLWEILKQMGIQDHLTFLLRSLYAGQEATVRTLHGTKWTDSNLGKEYIKSVYFSFFSITVQDIDFNYCDIEWLPWQ